MEKSPDAFRTISEVAEELDLPQHVLRFWETKFPQIRPLKRGGGRRYYRPDDVELLRGIRHLLYGEGYTIRGVQRILKEEGPRYVQAVLREAMDAPGEGEPGSGGSDAGEGRSAPEARTSSLSGFFGLLPGRRGGASTREVEPEIEPERGASRKPGRRRPSDDEPNFLDMPLLPDIDPRQTEPRHVAPRFEPPRPMEPRHSESRHVEPHQEPRHVEPRHVAPRFDSPDEDGLVFPFRGVGGEPEPPMTASRHAEPPEPFSAPYAPASAAHEEPSARLTSFRPLQGPEDGLSDDEVRQLKAALVDLQECYRLLLEARRGEA
ncbi:hypothetical protein GCM10017653_05580 [Ancylobacter defluvii]|uniref:HTH merR-type domain-containing protein n=1 Tax=Ancylobacter defluvii TaxID=1282440 RepID=A0A9W6JV96_9HYPH|nr:MerR family transcriptional regulator [Ancylobacter defluvii]GLK82489.1 hypothetical protein GCM10017653_05580 [Ancylobacter defluvii]